MFVKSAEDYIDVYAWIKINIVITITIERYKLLFCVLLGTKRSKTTIFGVAVGKEGLDILLRSYGKAARN